MYYYFAPMEGITGYHFRNIHHELFPGTHKYFTPFRVACQDIGFRKKELEDLLPEHNAGVPVVPQILSNDAGAFLVAVRQLQDLGYQEINLNLGCPSGTVISKYRVWNGCFPKTRLGSPSRPVSVWRCRILLKS